MAAAFASDVTAPNVCSTLNDVPSRETLNTVPVPSGPPARATPYRKPSLPSISAVSGYAPSAFFGLPSTFDTDHGSKRCRIVKPVPSVLMLNTVPVVLAVMPTAPSDVVP